MLLILRWDYLTQRKRKKLWKEVMLELSSEYERDYLDGYQKVKADEKVVQKASGLRNSRVQCDWPTVHPLHPQPLEITNPLSVSMYLPVLDFHTSGITRSVTFRV